MGGVGLGVGMKADTPTDSRTVTRTDTAPESVNARQLHADDVPAVEW